MPDLLARKLLEQEGSLRQGMVKVNAYLEQAKTGVYLPELKRNGKLKMVKLIKE